MDTPEHGSTARQLGSLNNLVREGLPVFLGDVVLDQLGVVGEAGGEGGGPCGDSEAPLEGWRAGRVGEGDSAGRGDGWGAQATVFVGRKVVIVIDAVCGLRSICGLGGKRGWARRGAAYSLGPG